MIKALIIDDEPSAIKTLQLMLQRYASEVSPLEATTNAAAAPQLISMFKPQLIFLDIQMPVISGFELLKKIPDINFEIIFTTAHDQYAIQAIRFSALDYLLKPIDADELRTAIDRYISKHDSQQSQYALYENLLHNIQSDKKDFRLAVTNSEGTYFLLPQEIIRLEGESNYTKFFLLERKPVLTSKTLKEYEEILNDHGFVRAHKSHLVNSMHVLSYNNDSSLLMKDNSVVEVSRRRKDEVMEALKRK